MALDEDIYFAWFDSEHLHLLTIMNIKQAAKALT